MSSDELTIIAFTSGCALIVAALSRHYVSRDFDVFYASAVNVAHHLDPYLDVGAYNTNLPHLVALTAPLAAFPLQAAYWMWTAINAAAVLFSLYLAGRVRRLPITPRAVAVFLAHAGTFYQLAGGQVAWLLAYPMTLAWLLGPTLGAGLLLGLCASAKPFLFLFVPYVLWRREWRGFFGICLGAIVALSFGFAVVGPQSYVSWWHAVTRLNTAFHYSNCALYGVLARMAQPEGLHLITPELAQTIGLVASVAIAAFTFVALRSGLGRDREWALVLVTAMLMSPLGQPYYLALAVGPLWATLRRMNWPRWGWGVLGLFWWPNVLTSPAPPTARWQLVFYNLAAFGLFSLWAVLGFGRVHQGGDVEPQPERSQAVARR